MSYSLLSKRALTRIFTAVLGASGALLAGCAEQEPERVSESSAVRTEGAVTASETERGRPGGEQVTSTMAFPTGDRATSDLLVEESVPRETPVNQPYRYQIRVTNLRAIRMNGVVLQQRLPAHVQVPSVPAAAPGSTTQPSSGQDAGSQTARIEIGELEPHQTKTMQMTGTPTQQGKIDMCMTAQYNAPMLCTQLNVVAPALTLTAEGPSQADICQDVVFRYTAANTGTGTARNVRIQSELPAGLQTVDGQQTFSAEMGNLSAGERKSVTVRLRALQAGAFNTQAVARSDNTGEAQGQQVATQILAPRLALNTAAPKEDFLGDSLTCRVTVKNTGDAPATETHVKINATPGVFTFVSAEKSEGMRVSQESWGTGLDFGTLAPGDSRTVGVVYRSEHEGAQTFNATAEAKCAEAVTSPVSVVIRSITASALEVTHDPDPVHVGNTVVYHITVENKGTGADHNVAVTATLPDSEQYIQGKGATNVNIQGQQITFAPIGVLGPKQRAAWDVEVKALRNDQAQVKVNMVSESTPNAAVKIEPTKLYGGEPAEAQPGPGAAAPATNPTR